MSSTFDGGGIELATDILPDGRGSVYVAGAAQVGGRVVAWLARFDENFTLISSTTLSGSAGTFDVFRRLAVDAGHVYVVGGLNDGADPALSCDAVLAKYTPSLVLVSSVVVNGSASQKDEARAVALDGAGRLYVVGTVSQSGNGSNIWLARYNAGTMALESSTTYNGPANSSDEGHGVLLDGSHVYASGASTNLAGNGLDVWIARYDTSLLLNSLTTFDSPGRSADRAFHLARGPDGSLYAVGAQTFGSLDLWLGKFSPSLGLLAEAVENGAGNGTDELRRVQVDSRGNVYVIGVRAEQGSQDIYMARYSPGLQKISEETFNGSANSSDVGYVFSLDATRGTLYAAGQMAQATSDAWLAKFSIAGDIVSAPTDDVERVKVYPSPFKPSRDGVAAIANLPAGSEVSLHAFTGELVARFTADDLGGIAWDGRNASGEAVASGVYYGVAVGQGGRKTFKVVVQR